MKLDSDISTNQHPFSLKQAIHFHKVNFQYTNTPVLKNLTLELQVYKWTVILGESGVGKSTILKLIEKFYTEYEGKSWLMIYH